MDAPKLHELVDPAPNDDYTPALPRRISTPTTTTSHLLSPYFPLAPTRSRRTCEPGPYESFLDLSPPRSRFSLDIDLNMNIRQRAKDAARSSYEWLRTTFHAPRINYKDELEWNCVRIPLRWVRRRRRQNDGGNQSVPPSTFDYSSYRGPYSPSS
ncbi:hypothetical protein BS47DRAFT_1340672 [Hydnum rufescens UP504]|uniref:Uncharacterized protein n=1 Tax=Hydnum rufescens UP504 TaxID=1448309 RepID=A0A9P6E011_9AGAM|nr:hypothetical protein BS47DRAFT_1340672 [Hydnum rufescens UP504]